MAIICPNPGELAVAAAGKVAAYVNGHPGSLLCLAAGETPMAMLRELVTMQGRGLVDLRSVYYVGLDEWVGLGRADTGSCGQMMADTFYGPAGIPADRLRAFDGLAPSPEAECQAVAEWIDLRGGIGLAVLGIGMNGHVGFNEPGGASGKACDSVDLDTVTIAASAKYFGRSRPVARGMTVTLINLLKSDKVFLLASGAHKADIIRRAFGQPPDTAVPASLLQGHPALEVLLDRDAAGACL